MGLFDKFKKKHKLSSEESVKKVPQEEETIEQTDNHNLDEEENVKEFVDTAPKPQQGEQSQASDEEDFDNGYKPYAFALLKDRIFDLLEFRDKLYEDWKIEPQIFVRNNDNFLAFTFMLAGMTFSCSHIPMPIPNREAEIVSKYNYIWKDAAQATQEHQSFVMIALVKNPCVDKIKTCTLFSKICGVIMAMKNASAVYMREQKMIISPTEYRRQIEVIKEMEVKNKKYFPLSLWIYIGMAKGKEGGRGYTYGLQQLGKQEIEIIDQPFMPQKMFQLMNAFAYFIIVENIDLENGNRLNLDKEHQVIVEKSEGVMIKGESCKLIFPKDLLEQMSEKTNEKENLSVTENV